MFCILTVAEIEGKSWFCSRLHIRVKSRLINKKMLRYNEYSMKTNIVISGSASLLLRALCCLSIFSGAWIQPIIGSTAFAAQSPSFRLYDSVPNVGTPSPDVSASFLMNENGVTWVAQPVTSSHFMIVTGPLVGGSGPHSSASSSVPASGGVSSSSSSVRPSGGHRGNRIPPALHPSAAGSSASSSRAPAGVVSSAASSSLSDGVSHSSVGFGAGGSAALSSAQIRHPSVTCAGRDCLSDRPWSFGGIFVWVPVTLRSWIGLLCAAMQVFLLLFFVRRHHLSSSRRSSR